MDLEAELLKSASKEELERQIGERIKSFHGFLTREVAIRLIAKEMGLLRSEDRAFRLGEIPKGEKRIAFTAKIRKIWPIAAYSSGKRSRVVEVEDETGAKPLVLWNEDVELAKTLRTKDEISVRGAYEKGGELHLGYSGKIDVSDKAGFTDLAELKESETVHVRGFVSSVEGEDGFIREGRMARGFSFILSDGKNERRCVIFQGRDRAERLSSGDEIIVEGGSVKNGNIEIDSQTRLLSRRPKDMLLGTITKLETRNREPETSGRRSAGEGELVAEIDGREIALDRENALRFLGIHVAEDISLSTVVALKKDTLLNSRIALRIEEKDGQIVVRC
jgi:hypothetical protein